MEMYRGLAELLEAGQEAGEIRSDANRMEAAELLVAAWLHVTQNWLTGWWQGYRGFDGVRYSEPTAGAGSPALGQWSSRRVCNRGGRRFKGPRGDAGRPYQRPFALGSALRQARYVPMPKMK